MINHQILGIFSPYPGRGPERRPAGCQFAFADLDMGQACREPLTIWLWVKNQSVPETNCDTSTYFLGHL
jgi:hypothetical protein